MSHLLDLSISLSIIVIVLTKGPVHPQTDFNRNYTEKIRLRIKVVKTKG